VLAACLLTELALLPVGIDDLDEGYFVQQALRILHGQVPYRDFESLYTPGLQYLHAAIFGALGGPYLLAPRALSLICRVAVAVLLYLLARPVVKQPIWAGLPGAVILLGFDPAPDLWEPHPGWPSTTLALLATWCVAHSTTPRWLLGSGLAAGAAYAFKQNAGALILLALVLHLRRRALLPLLGFALVTVVWLVPLLAAIGGRLDLLGPFVGAINAAALFAGPEQTIAIPAACVVAGLVSLHEPRVRWYLVAGTCLLGTQYPRADTLHLVWSTPVLLVVGAAFLSRIRTELALAAVAVTMLLCEPSFRSRIDAIRRGTTSVIGLPYANGLRTQAQTWSDVLNTVAEIQHRTQPGEPIFVYPTSPLLYVLSQRPNATRFDHFNPGAATPTQIQATIDALEDADVRVLAVSDYWRANWGPPRENAVLEDWLFSRFRRVANFGAYSVFTRTEADL